MGILWVWRSESMRPGQKRWSNSSNCSDRHIIRSRALLWIALSLTIMSATAFNLVHVDAEIAITPLFGEAGLSWTNDFYPVVN